MPFLKSQSIFGVFRLFWGLCHIASQPYRPRQCPLHQSILLTQGPTHEIFTKKYWELVELENDLSLRRPFWFFCFIFWKRPMGYHFFLYYRWLLQNLRKDFIRTNMHTTVASLKSKAYNVFFPIIILHFWMVQSYINLGIPC